jgi:hypothetical protein
MIVKGPYNSRWARLEDCGVTRWHAGLSQHHQRIDVQSGSTDSKDSLRQCNLMTKPKSWA